MSCPSPATDRPASAPSQVSTLQHDTTTWMRGDASSTLLEVVTEGFQIRGSKGESKGWGGGGRRSSLSPDCEPVSNYPPPPHTHTTPLCDPPPPPSPRSPHSPPLSVHHRIYLCDPNKPNTKIIKRSPSAKTMVREGRKGGRGGGSDDYGEGVWESEEEMRRVGRNGGREGEGEGDRGERGGGAR